MSFVVSIMSRGYQKLVGACMYVTQYGDKFTRLLSLIWETKRPLQCILNNFFPISGLRKFNIILIILTNRFCFTNIRRVLHHSADYIFFEKKMNKKKKYYNFLIQFNAPFKIISLIPRRANR